MRTLLLTLVAVNAALAQNPDTSNNAALHGAYFVREVYISGQNSNSAISSASSAIGVATFDGAGNYSFAPTTGATITGVYGVGSNGFLYIQSLVDGTQEAYGTLAAVGPSAFVASATENGNGDILVAIPAGSSASAASLKGNYTAGYVAFPNADVTQVREASFNFAADGAGNLSSVTVNGTALSLGGTAAAQTIPGATYTLAGTGSGALNLGTASSAQVLSGSLTFYLSADGNIFLAGTPGGDDLIVGARAFSGTGANSSWHNIYFTGGLEDSVSGTTHSIDAFYGSWNSNGQGVSVAHDRYNVVGPTPAIFDYTFDSQTPVQPNGTSAPVDLPYQFTLGAGGSVFIGTGTQGLYSLMVGFAAPVFTGSGVYLNPLGVVNAASFAPVTNPIAPGEIIALFGSGLAAGTVSASSLPLPTTLGNVQVLINGTPAPLFYVTSGQIAALVPQAISPANNVFNATIQVLNGSTSSNTVTVYTNYTSPGVFAFSNGGVGPAAAELSNYSLISAANPATIGSTVLLYATGLGQVSPAVSDGAAAPSNPPATATDGDAVYVGSQQENILFDGLTPGLASLYQVNATLLQGPPAGTDFSDLATPDGYTSETTIPVGGGTSSSARSRMENLKAHIRAQAGNVSRALFRAAVQK
jgi:uncharacterized protein (TIGR03437 family)